VISDGLWRRSFGADRLVIGTTVRINAHPMTVIGVTPPRFRGAVVGLATDVFVPITMQPRLIGHDSLDARDNRWVHAFLRPPDGMTRAQIEARASGVSRRLLEQHPRDSLADRAFIVSLWRWPYGAQSLMLPAVGLLGAMAALLLVVVAANAAGLVLVRGLARRGETAARLAVGASRARIVRQLVIESLVLTIPAAVIGFFLPGFGEPFLGAAAGNVSFPLAFNTAPDRFIVGFTVLVAFVTAFIYGLVPAVRLSRVDVASILKDDLSPRGSSTSRFRTALVVAQVAGALVLLVGTALILRTFESAQHADAGFDPHQVTWASFDTLAGGHDEASGRLVYRRLLDASRAESGVTAASVATFLPLNLIDMSSRDAQPEGYERRPDEDISPPVNIVSEDYFRTMGIPMAAGREFEAHDADAAEPPLIVNETFARRFWGSAEAAIGKHVGTSGQQATVVGVARDVKYARLDEQARPYMYLPFSHFYSNSMTLQVRSDADTAAVLERIRAHARALDAGMPILASGVMADQIRSASSLYETLARILGVVGVMAAALAALGVYGLVAYTVRQSAHEIGIRTAVGATRTMIVRQFLARGVALAAIGIAVGVLASLMLGRLMADLLYGVAATDVTSFAGASALVLGATIAASFIPAWRGSRVDPVVALRQH
jgi:predicted permease